jgi:hypothetical protein
VGAARDEYNLLPRLSEAPTEIPPDTATTEYSYTHTNPNLPDSIDCYCSCCCFQR